jgi:hypothetical protein
VKRRKSFNTFNGENFCSESKKVEIYEIECSLKWRILRMLGGFRGGSWGSLVECY